MQVQLTSEITERLARAGIAEAADDARAIVAEATSSGDPGAVARAMAEKRAAGTPLAYVIGRQRFMGLDFIAEPGVIVPRPVSELVGQTALRLVATMGLPANAGARVVDVCSGSGNLACGIAAALPSARAWSCDLMKECSLLAQRNVAALGLADRVQVVTGDLFAPLAGLGLDGQVDVIVSSPPFISTGRLAKDRAYLLEHEPREAFDAGPYGLGIHQRVVKEALPLLRDGGFLVCEIGEGQAKQVRMLFERARGYGRIEEASDAAGTPFVVWGEKRAAT